MYSKIVPLANNPHPKVRWSACNCIGQMSTDFGVCDVAINQHQT